MVAEPMIVSSFGGGFGINVSSIRPRDDKIFGKGGRASGPVSFLHGVNENLKTIESGGQRRAAALAVMNCDHPDIFLFLDAKLKEGSLDHFNISVGITEEFVKAVRKDKDWDLKFGNKVYSTIKAKALWRELIKNAYSCGDPGILNLSNIQGMSNTQYFENIECTNPCGEIAMSPYSLCDLGSINLNNMYNSQTGGVRWKHLKSVINTAIRMLDNVLDVTFYPLKPIEENSTASRRIGLGTMGLHHLLLKMGLKYGSDDSLEFIDELYSKIRDLSYLASSELAKEKGSFKRLDIDKYMETPFIKSLPRRVQKSICVNGIRNCTCLTVPPTGTTSIVAGTSSGIEPVIAPVYKRVYNSMDKLSDKTKTEEKLFVDPVFAKTLESDGDLSHFTTAHDIDPEQQLDILITIQKYIDSSISKTINIPNDYPESKLEKILLDSVSSLKGVTVYRSGSKGKEILIPVDHKKMKKEDILAIDNSMNSIDTCRSGGACDI